MKCKTPSSSILIEGYIGLGHVRIASKAGRVIRENNIDVVSTLDKLKASWAGHIVRFGLGAKEPHLLKAVMFWRPLSWRQYQKLFNDSDPNPVKHAKSVGRPKRWDEQFSSNWAVVMADLQDPA